MRCSRRHVLHPDALFQLSDLGDWQSCPLEFERRAKTCWRALRPSHSSPSNVTPP